MRGKEEAAVAVGPRLGSAAASRCLQLSRCQCNSARSMAKRLGDKCQRSSSSHLPRDDRIQHKLRGLEEPVK